MTTKKIDYQALQAELDELLLALQAGELDIDASFKAYQRADEIISVLDTYLETAENQITELSAKRDEA